jgi:hypothetical protein
MTMRLLVGGMGLVIFLSTVAAAAPRTAPTFNKDVLPILQQRCQSCHRPGQIAPMSLLTYAMRVRGRAPSRQPSQEGRCHRGSPIRSSDTFATTWR